MSEKIIGVIGGSGLYEIEGLTGVEEINIDTPFGKPSDSFIRGKMGDVEMIFLPRHARGHRILPSEVNSRANIYGFKKLGAKMLLSVSAVGSLKEQIKPGHIVLVDQFIDRTKGQRASTFFGDGLVGHVSVAEPVCPVMRSLLAKACKSIKFHKKGTYITMEGPQFSTKAESHVYRMLKADVIGMTACPEYKLAREAELHFGIIALSTDYDCWKAGEEHVNADAVVKIIQSNVAKAKNIIKNFAAIASKEWAKFQKCECEHALDHAIMTKLSTVPQATKDRISVFTERFFK